MTSDLGETERWTRTILSSSESQSGISVLHWWSGSGSFSGSWTELDDDGGIDL